MSDALIRAAFESRLSTWAVAQVPPIPVAYQNVAFTPPNGRYARCWILPVPTQSGTLDGLHRERKGVFQVDLCMPTNAGSAAVNALVASLDAAFPVVLTQGAIKVFLLSPMSQSSSIQEANHYMVPVSCEYRSDTV